MANIRYTNDPSGYTLQTSGGPTFGGGAAPGFDSAPWSSFFSQMAARKMAAQKAAAEEDRRRWEAEFRLKEQAMQPPPQSVDPNLRMRQALEAKQIEAQLAGPSLGEQTMEVTPGGQLAHRMRWSGPAGGTGSRGVGVYDERFSGSGTASRAGEAAETGGGVMTDTFEDFRKKSKERSALGG